MLVSVPDLFFLTRIHAAAHHAGVTIEECALAELEQRCEAGLAVMVILDLHAPGDPLAVARALKSNPASAATPIVGFYSHVDQNLRQRALAAGVDRVLPRSAFTARLPALLAGTE